MSDSNYLKIAAAIIVPNAGGWMGSLITRKNLKPWYASLNKPKGNPPNIVFGPTWTAIYCGMGYASYLVYKDLLATGNGFNGTAQTALLLYANQLALNWAWTPIFFHFHSLKWSSVEIVATLFSATACGFAFVQINKMAGLLFIPYIGWLSYATYLNVSIYKLNGTQATTSETTKKLK